MVFLFWPEQVATFFFENFTSSNKINILEIMPSRSSSRVAIDYGVRVLAAIITKSLNY